MMNPFIERHQDSISGVLSCFDRVVITGTLPDICHAGAMGGYLGYRKIRLFDYPRWAEPLREELRENAERLAAEAGLKIEFIRKLKAFRKEARIKEILAERGDHPGPVHLFSAMESCLSYQPWHDKSTHRTFLKPSSGKCLHYYFYFIWGFRVVSTRLGAKPRQTWAPAISENSACAYASEDWLGCAKMARTRLGSGIARDLKTCRTGCGTSFIRKKTCVGV